MSDLIDRNQLLKWLKVSDFENYNGDKCFRYTIQEIENAPAVNRWLPCSERLPEAGMPVLIYGCRHRVTAYYDNCKNLFRLTENDNLYYIAEFVTHWMPLPEPPKE